MMPENKPMKMQWLNIDGRQVPSILPNHWNEQKNDWDITGTKNPLPVANYTQNASGVWLPTSKDNPVPTQLTGSNVENIELIRNETMDLRTESQYIIGGNLGLVDVRKYKDVSILFYNRHDTVLSFSVQGKPIRDGDSPTLTQVVPNTNIPSGATAQALSSQYELLRAVQPYLRIRVVRENTSPTSGRLECWIFGSVR